MDAPSSAGVTIVVHARRCLFPVASSIRLAFPSDRLPRHSRAATSCAAPFWESVTMPTKRTPATEKPGTDPEWTASCEHLLDLIARLLARRWLRVQGEEVKGKGTGKNSPQEGPVI